MKCILNPSIRSTAFFILWLAGLCILQASPAQADRFTQAERKYLINSLRTEPFSDRFLKGIFYDSRLKKQAVVVSKNIHHKEDRRNYEDFYSPYSFFVAKRFSKKWRSVLEEAANRFDVDKEVLVAILLVETGLGNVLGKYPVISVFSSILVEHEAKKNEFKMLDELSPDQLFVKKRLEAKAEWAHQELSALLTIVKLTDQCPFHLKGSYAGAFGIPQFLPSSYVKWGYDSDNNGTVNLFLFPDAIFSTANYLKAHGWKKGLYRESNKDVIYMYNKSEVYVETVLDIAKKIKVSQDLKPKKTSEQTRSTQSLKSRSQESTS